MLWADSERAARKDKTTSVAFSRALSRDSQRERRCAMLWESHCCAFCSALHIALRSQGRLSSPRRASRPSALPCPVLPFPCSSEGGARLEEMCKQHSKDESWRGTDRTSRARNQTTFSTALQWIRIRKEGCFSTHCLYGLYTVSAINSTGGTWEALRGPALRPWLAAATRPWAAVWAVWERGG